VPAYHPAIGHHQLDKLRPEHVQIRIKGLQAKELHRTTQYARALLVRAINQAVKWRLVAYNIAALREAPRVERHEIEPLALEQARALREHLKRQETAFPHAEYVFVSSHGTAIDPRNLLCRFKRALERAKLPGTIRFHDLRHSCATFLTAQGEYPRVIMEILGHAQMRTTMNIYGRILDSMRCDAIPGLDAFLSDG
jgi:integrase